MRLLLVEDDTMIGEVVLDLLRAEHYAVDWVKDAGRADPVFEHKDVMINPQTREVVASGQNSASVVRPAH
eukprot:gene34938-39508_t